MTPKTNLGTRARPEESRKAILEAASREFASEGITGARIDAIARAAGVNKALLYYYFQDKEALYGATLDYTLGSLLEELVRILDTEREPGFKLVSYLLKHFDYVANHPDYRRLIQHEMMRAGSGRSEHFARLVHTFFRPLMLRVSRTLEEGIASGEFRKVQPMQTMQSMISVVVFYFTAVPVIREVGGFDPLSPKALSMRREAMIDFVAGALFANYEHGAAVVSDVLQLEKRASKGATQGVTSTKGRKK